MSASIGAKCVVPSEPRIQGKSRSASSASSSHRHLRGVRPGSSVQPISCSPAGLFPCDGPWPALGRRPASSMPRTHGPYAAGHRSNSCVSPTDAVPGTSEAYPDVGRNDPRRRSVQRATRVRISSCAAVVRRLCSETDAPVPGATSTTRRGPLHTVEEDGGEPRGGARICTTDTVRQSACLPQTWRGPAVVPASPRAQGRLPSFGKHGWAASAVRRRNAAPAQCSEDRLLPFGRLDGEEHRRRVPGPCRLPIGSCENLP